MAPKTNRVALVVVVVVAAAVLLESTAAATYYVGDTLGWKVPPAGLIAYTNWASQHTFVVGDVLVFNFTTGQHDAAKVTRDAFNACNTTNYITLESNGPANYTLSTAGQDYFICTFSNHCSLGQKLEVNVSTTGSPTSSPSPGTNTPPPPPPPPSSAPPTANIATFSIIFMSINVIALLC